MTAVIQSSRLDLVTLTPDFLRASLDGNIGKAAELLRLSLPAGWPGEHAWKLDKRLKQLERDIGLQPWLVRAMRARNTGVMLGLIGFHDAPGVEYPCLVDPSAAEFGFSVFSEHRRRGFAREASVALMGWASDQEGVTDFVVTIRPDNVASQAVARSLGFRRLGFHIDDIDGEEDVLHRHGTP